MLVLVMGVALSPRKREAVLRFDPVVSQETVGSFCRRLEISTSSFYRLRATAGVEGFAGGYESSVAGTEAAGEPVRDAC